MQKSAEVKVAIDVDALGDQIAEMSAHIDAAMHRLLTAIREFDIAAGWHVQGALSCAHWLAWRVGWDLRTARERVRALPRNRPPKNRRPGNILQKRQRRPTGASSVRMRL